MPKDDSNSKEPKSEQVKSEKVRPIVANPDAWGRLIGPQTVAPIMIDGVETMTLLDTGSQTSLLSKKWVNDLGLPLYELEKLVDMEGADGSLMDYEGFTEITITSKELPELNMSIPVLVVPYIPYHDQVPLTLGTLTLQHIFDSGILEKQEDLHNSWINMQKSLELKKQLEGSPDTPLGCAKLTKSFTIPAFQTKVVHCLSKAKNYNMQVNVIVEGSDSKIPEGLEVQNTYTELMPGSKKVTVAIRNTSARNIKVSRGTVVGNIFTANKVPKIISQSVRIGQNDVEENSSDSSVDPSGDSSSNSGNDQSWILDKLDLSGMDSWSEDLQSKAKDLLVSYSDIFSKHDLDMGKTDLIKHHIKLSDYTPFKQPYRRIPPHFYEEVRALLKEMLELGAIRRSQSPWCSPIVLVRKKDGKLRFCIDLRKLNMRTIKDNYSLPKIDHHLEQLIGAEWFSTLDLKAGYWQVELDEESKALTAFTCGPLGFYECEVMPFGSSNAPATFQRLMENCLGDLNLSWCVVYLDDIIVFGKSPEEQLSRLTAVFEKLRKAKLKLKPSKCNFFKQSISYLGHIVSKDGIATDPSKVEDVKKWPKPKTLNDLRSFLGFVGYYRKFIKNFSSIAKPLNDLLQGIDNTKKGVKQKPVKWELEQQIAFDELKDALCDSPVLGYADYTKPFILHTDASLDGLGAVLYQLDPANKLRVIAYASRSLSKSERNYSVHKLEFLALKWAITDKFKEYLYGPNSFFEVYTDNNPLTYVLTSAKLDATTQRWVAELASYNFDIFYRSGKHNVDADSLSRIKWPESVEEVIINRKVCVKVSSLVVQATLFGVSVPYGFVETISKSAKVIPKPDTTEGMTAEQWKIEQSKDPAVHFIAQLLMEGNLFKRKHTQLELNCPQVKPYLRFLKQFQLQNGLLYRKVYSDKVGKQAYFLQLVLPCQMVNRAIIGCHDEVGHLGRDKTLDLLRERFFWPSLYKDVVNHISNCRSCIKRKGVSPKEELCPITASRPLELVHMDYLTLEPSKGNVENILVITDHFTRYAQAFPSKTQTAQATAKILWENFISHYGFPEKFISDQGRNFESDLIKDLCKIAKVDKIRTTPYHPMTNGQCERFNKTLLNMLGTLTDEEKSDWKSHLSAMTFAYNCTRNASTNYSPYYLMFGRHPRLAVDVAFGIHKQGNKIGFSKSKYVDRLQRRLNYAYEKAESFSKKESERNRIRYNKNAKNVCLETDDLVLVRVVAHKGKHKIQNKWEDDEYVVLDQPNPDIPVYTVKPVNGGRERTLHRNLLLPLDVKLTKEEDSDQEFEVINPLVRLDKKKRPKIPDEKAHSKVTDQSVDQVFSPSAIFDNSQVELTQNSSGTYSEPDTKETFLSSQESTSPNTTNLTNITELIQNAPDPPSSIDTEGDLTKFILDEPSNSEEQEENKDSTNSSFQSQVVDPQEEGEQIDEVTGVEKGSNDNDVESDVKPRRSSRSNFGAPPTRFGTVVSHMLAYPLYYVWSKTNSHDD